MKIKPRDFFALAGKTFYMPEKYMMPGWMGLPITSTQKVTLENAGLKTDELTCRGHASKVINLLDERRNKGLASPKQMERLRQLGWNNIKDVTKKDASMIIADSRYW